jgi:hypothetical protein
LPVEHSSRGFVARRFDSESQHRTVILAGERAGLARRLAPIDWSTAHSINASVIIAPR